MPMKEVEIRSTDIDVTFIQLYLFDNVEPINFYIILNVCHGCYNVRSLLGRICRATENNVLLCQLRLCTLRLTDIKYKLASVIIYSDPFF